MAIKLSSKTNTGAPNTTFPYGFIQDDPGNGSGTPVNTQVYGDFHQFFARISAIGDITLNDLPEGHFNGFQYVDALQQVVGMFSNINTYTATQSLISANFAALNFYNSVSNGIFYLPAVSPTNQLKRVFCGNLNTGILQVLGTGTDIISGVTTNGVFLNQYDFVELTVIASGQYLVTNIYRIDRSTNQVTLSLGSGWTGTAQYYIDNRNVVRLRGTLTCNNTSSSYVSPFTLPVGFRPSAAKSIPTCAISSYLGTIIPATINISTAGVVTLATNTVSNPDTLTVYFDGISFYTNW